MAKKKHNFGPDFGVFGPNPPPPPKFLVLGFNLYYMLDIVASYHCMQLQGKYIQTQENGKKPHLGPDLGPLGTNLSHQIFVQKSGFVSQ